MRKKRSRALALGGSVLISLCCKAQIYRPTAGALLDTVKKTGFYRIVLPPQLVASCRSDLADIRIGRPDGSIIPYVLHTDAGSVLNAGYFPLPDPMIRQKDSSNKHSYILLTFPDAYRIERLSLVVQNPILYKRTAQVTDVDASPGTAAVVTISIDPNDTTFRIPAVKTRHLLIDIMNKDNAPLTISRVATAQSGVYVIAHLEQYREYEVTGGDSLASPPDYDLHYFTDSLREPPLDIAVTSIHRKEPGKAPARVGESNRWTILLWSALVLVLLLLIYLSVKMVRAIAKKEPNDRL
jgi:hypothetical protein